MTNYSQKMLIAFVLFISIVFFDKANGNDSGNSCPKLCTCHSDHLSHTSFASAHYKTKNINFQPVKRHNQQNNNVLSEDDHELNDIENDPVLKIAICMTNEQKGEELSTVLQDTEVLTVLQSTNNENVTLSMAYFKGMKHLKYLEIQGVNKKKQTNSLFLKHQAFRFLDSLEYINLENIQFLGSPAQGNKILPESAYEYTIKKYESNQILSTSRLSEEQMYNKIQKRKKQLPKDLVFLTPNDPEPEVVPYEIYKEDQQRIGVYSFAGLKSLKYLRIHKCNLKEIDWEMFEGLRSLETLALEGNDLLFIPEFAFYGTQSLKSLSLAHNKLLNIQSLSFAGLLQLEYFDLSHNNISHLSEMSLPPLPQLVVANFESNPLQMIFPSTFEIMNTTKSLYLGSPDTKLNIQPNSFSGLESLLMLKLINVDHDILEREVLKGMPRLQRLEMKGRIRAISFDAFLEVYKLQYLILSNCSITKLSMDSFYGLYELRQLDLSNNQLNSLPPGLLDQQYVLKELYLQNNNFTTLPIGIFQNIPAKLIRLDGNPWHCSCHMKDWKPSIINQVKQKSDRKGKCMFGYDKGNCLSEEETFIYDKTVEPRCATPKKYQEWGVFHMLHKVLTCDKKLKQPKFDRKAYLEQKLLDYEKKLKNKMSLLTPQKDYHKTNGHKLSGVLIKKHKNINYNNANTFQGKYKPQKPIYKKKEMNSLQNGNVNTIHNYKANTVLDSKKIESRDINNDFPNELNNIY